MAGAVTLQRPYFHFPKPLAAALSFAAQWLLSNQRIGTHRTHMDFVFHQMIQFHHVNHAYGNFVVKFFSVPTIVKINFTALRQAGFFEFFFNILFRRAVERRSDGAVAKLAGGPTQMGFQNLPDIHSGSDSQRIQNYIHRRAVGQIWHIFFGKNFGNNSLVAVTTRQFVARLNFSQLRHIDLNFFQHSRLQFVALVAGKNFNAHHATSFSVRQ